MTSVDFTEEDQEYFGRVRLSTTDVLDTTSILSMKNVHKTYLLGVEGIPALRGVSLSVRRGEFVVIFGTSGGGKTTMLNVIGTIDKPTKGEMFLCGHRITDKTKDNTLADMRLCNLGFVFQTFNLLKNLTALGNVEMPMILRGRLSAAERRARATELLSTVGLQHRLDHYPNQLSGGEQQRVAIARALANEPDILLLDEPTGDLDSVNSAIVMRLLCHLHKKSGITLIMVTHDVHLKMFADRVVWMRDGKIQRIETVSKEAKRAARADLKRALVDAQNKTKEVQTRIEVRQPEHYETHENHDGPSSHFIESSKSTTTTTAAANGDAAEHSDEEEVESSADES